MGSDFVDVMIERVTGAIAMLDFSNPLTGEQVKTIHSTVVSKCKIAYTGWDLLECIVDGMRKAYAKVRELGFERALDWLQKATPSDLIDP